MYMHFWREGDKRHWGSGPCRFPFLSKKMIYWEAKRVWSRGRQWEPETVSTIDRTASADSVCQAQFPFCWVFLLSSVNIQDSNFLFGFLSLRQWFPRISARIKCITITGGTMQNDSYTLTDGDSVLELVRGWVPCMRQFVKHCPLVCRPQGHWPHNHIFSSVIVLTTDEHTGLVITLVTQSHGDKPCLLCLSIQLRSSNLEKRKKYTEMGVLSRQTWLWWKGHISWRVLPGWPSLPEGKRGKNRPLSLLIFPVLLFKTNILSGYWEHESKCALELNSYQLKIAQRKKNSQFLTF